ncbi:MAG: hypothetical protein JWM68_4070, partial [Verrucomicrobiales bacterium]|nr:hypothetical protein [Verrucomicrobiales bacterium]
MKRSLSLGLFSLALLAGCLQITIVKQSEHIPISQMTFSTNYVQQGEVTSVPGQIEVENKAGEIEVHGADVTAVSWSWELQVRATDEGAAQEAIHAATCRTGTEQNTLRVAVSFPESGKKYTCRSNLKLTVPKSVSVKTHTSYGETRIATLNGNVEARDQSGSVKIRSIHG